MTWTSILDILAELGTATAYSLWLPVLAWTALVLPLWILLERTDRLHPLAEYRLSQVLLFTLPLGLGAAGLASFLPAPAVPVDAALEAPRTALPPVEFSAPPPIETTAPETTSTPMWHWTQAVGLLMIAALLLALVQLGRLVLNAVALVRIHSSIDDSSDESIQSLTQRLAERLGVGRSVRVRRTPNAIVPITLGGLQPTILLPPGLAEHSEALRMTLRHELVHIRRYDDLTHLAERLVAALFAVHPLAGRLRRHIVEARERACDAAVLQDGQSSSAAYARLLAAFAEGNPRPGRLGALSLSESPSSLHDRLSSMRSSVPKWLSSQSQLGPALVTLGLVLTVGVAACADSADPSPTNAQSDSSILASGDSVWTPIEDARAVGDDWLTHFNEGNATQSYDGAAPMTESLSQEKWAAWIEKRRSQIGAEQRRRFMFAQPYGDLGPSGSPSVRLRYMLEYESGETCQPAIVMVLVESSWKVGAFGPPCSDLSFPEGASAATEMTSSHQLPRPTDGRDAFRREVTDPELKKAIGRGATVRVEFVVDESGRVSDPQVSRSLPPKSSASVESAAIQALRSVEFEPGRLNGEPVPTRMSVPVLFRPSAQ